jgi:DNA primase small subunit
VCVPIDTRRVEEFDPLAVPTVQELLGEVDKWGEENQLEDSQSEKKLSDWEKTSLKPYVEYFRGFVAALLKDEKVVKREADAMEF